MSDFFFSQKSSTSKGFSMEMWGKPESYTLSILYDSPVPIVCFHYGLDDDGWNWDAMDVMKNWSYA